MSQSAGSVFAVVGATGQQGGATARALLARGARIRALVRRPTSNRANDLARLGAEVVTADLDDPETVRSAFEGTTGVFAMTSPTVENGTEGEVAHGRTIADAAKHAHLEHVVYSSVAGVDRSTGIPHFESKHQVEQYIDSLGLPRTFVRPVFFMENFNRAAPVVVSGTRILRLPLPPDVPLQLIAVEDIGTVCASALLNPGEVAEGSVEIAGDTRTPREIADILGGATNLPGRFEELPLSTLDNDFDRQTMFAWYARPASTRADLIKTRQLAPNLADLRTWSDERLRVE